MLGNLSVEEIEKYLEIELSQEDKGFLTKTHQAEAQNIASDKWHCFYLPTIFMCGSKNFADNIYKIFSKYNCKNTMQICW